MECSVKAEFMERVCAVLGFTNYCKTFFHFPNYESNLVNDFCSKDVLISKMTFKNFYGESFSPLLHNINSPQIKIINFYAEFISSDNLEVIFMFISISH